MALSFSRPDPSQPSAVSSASFSLTRRGFDQAEVRDFLRMVAAELARLQERERFLEHELRSAQRSGPSPVAALDEEVVTRLLGEEAARILQTARDGAATIRQRAEDHAVRLLREATDEAHRIVHDAENEANRTRQDAATDAESELAMAKQHGREMVTEVRAYRERVLAELARRRELAREQIEQLVHGRERLVQAFERARIAAVDVLGDLAPLIEPDEYVNLSPTTGPVPLMVPNTPPPPQRRGPAFVGDEAAAAGDVDAAARDAAAPNAAASAAAPANAPAATEVPDAPAVRADSAEQASTSARGSAATAVTTTAGDDAATIAEAGSARVFDVEVDDPELASTADEPARDVVEQPARRVPGVIDRAAEPEQVDEVPSTTSAEAAAAPAVPDADAATPTTPTPATNAPAEPTSPAPRTKGSSGTRQRAADRSPGPSDTTDRSDPTDAASRAPRTDAGKGSTPQRDRTAGTDGASTDSAAPTRATRSKKAAPLPGETVVERPSAGARTAAVGPGTSSPADAADDDRPLAPVVSLFSSPASSSAESSNAASSPAAGDAPPPPAAPNPPKSTVDDLFAKLRAARTDNVAESVSVVPEPSHPSHGDAASTSPTAAEPRVEPSSSRPARTAPRVPAIFQASQPEPAPAQQADAAPADDSLFGRREAVVAPLIVTASRSLKRVLADEQNDVLAVLRRREPVRSLDALVPASAEHIARYIDAISTELLESAVAGAASVEAAKRPALEKAVTAGGAVQRAAEMLANQLIDPLRERIDRLVADAGGANADLAASLRELYREWKTRHIDRHVDEAVRVAFGYGALAGVAPGTKMCWLVDPSGPPCADADDNALGGPVSAGQPFPTDHLCAPAHAGCRCMLTKADR